MIHWVGGGAQEFGFLKSVDDIDAAGPGIPNLDNSLVKTLWKDYSKPIVSYNCLTIYDAL